MQLNNNILNVMPKACIFPEFYQFLGNGVLHIYFLIAWAGGLCQCCCVFIIAFNRLTTLLLPQTKLWRYPYLQLFFVLQIVPGLIVGITTVFPKVAWEQRDCGVIGNIIEDLNANGDKVTRIYFKIGAVVLGLTALSVIIMYSIIFYRIKTVHMSNKNMAVVETHNYGIFLTSQQKREFNILAIVIIMYSIIFYRIKTVHMSNKNMAVVETHNYGIFLTSQQKREFNILAMSVIICIMQLVYTIYISSREVFKFDQNYIGLNLMQDLCAGINPFLLIIFSQTLRNSARKQLLNMFGTAQTRNFIIVPPTKSAVGSRTNY
uniref:G-protein coupled receptors family 1 profile domain-containing protein n=1 Tax=Panagrolaimus sp. JU765 TaxID=591449 RepID=A0AC34RLJ9_9BILA